MTVAELTQSIQFTVDQHGAVTAVVITPDLWQRIVEALEESEDRALVQNFRARLIAGPVSSAALRWQDVDDDWK